jgi:hypothetical protein
MAVEFPVMVKTFEAAADLSTKQYFFVKLTSTFNRVNVCTGATDKPIGVLRNKPDAAGKAAEVMIVGITKGSADAALSIGDLVGTSADSQVDAKTPGTDTTEYVTGQVLEAATAAADLITMTVDCLNIHRAA